MLLTNEDLSAEGLGAVFAIFLGVLVALRVATKPQVALHSTRGIHRSMGWFDRAAGASCALRRLWSQGLLQVQASVLVRCRGGGCPDGTNRYGRSQRTAVLAPYSRPPHGDKRLPRLLHHRFRHYRFRFCIFHRPHRARASLHIATLVDLSLVAACVQCRRGNWMAIALLLVGLTWYLRKRTRWFYAWVAIATGFHFSAAIFFAFPFFIWLLFRRRGIAWTALVLAFTNAVAFGSSSILSSVLAGTRYSDYLVDQTSSFGYILPMLTLTLAGVYILRRTEQVGCARRSRVVPSRTRRPADPGSSHLHLRNYHHHPFLRRISLYQLLDHPTGCDRLIEAFGACHSVPERHRSTLVVARCDLPCALHLGDHESPIGAATVGRSSP